MVKDKEIGNQYKTTTNRGGGGAAKGEKPDAAADITKIGKVVGKLGSALALVSSKKLPAVFP